MRKSIQVADTFTLAATIFCLLLEVFYGIRQYFLWCTTQSNEAHMLSVEPIQVSKLENVVLQVMTTA
jgi:hypothetical protein